MSLEEFLSCRSLITRRDFLKIAGISASYLALGESPLESQSSGRKPDIILIVADDLGYADLGVYGCKDIPTPNIDSIAENGVRFTNGYVTCPVCSPTRAGLLTGRYQQRFGHEFNTPNQTYPEDYTGLPLTETTLADRLKAAGYATGIFGKWHLGSKPEYHPQKRGFDEFFGFPNGYHDYFKSDFGEPENFIYRGNRKLNRIDYTTDAFAREAVSFIERHKDQPFFVYLPFNAVHTPLQAPESYLSRFSEIKDKKRRTFAAMLSSMDDGVGRVISKLKELKLEDNAIIFFISDNGGITPKNTSRNNPFRGLKGQVFEGGVRVPFLMQWKAQVPGGKVYDKPVVSLDILPTAVQAASGAIPNNAGLDGVDLVPYVNGKSSADPHEMLYWRWGTQNAIRKGDWKLLKMNENPPELYNLEEDPGETDNLALKNPEKVRELQAAYDAWNARLIPPKWQSQPGNIKPVKRNQN